MRIKPCCWHSSALAMGYELAINMRFPFVARTFWWSTAFLAAAAVGLSAYAAFEVERTQQAQILAALEQHALALASALEESRGAGTMPAPPPNERPGIMTTLIDAQRNVLSGPALGAAGGREVQSALAGRSATWAEDSVQYFAVPLGVGARPAAVLVARQPLDSVRAAGEAIWKSMLRATGLAALLGLAAIAWGLASGHRRVQQQRHYIEGILEDPSVDLNLPFGDDDLGALSLTLRTMQPRITDLVQRSKTELAFRECILSSMAEGVIAVDKHLNITFSNENFAKYAGTVATPGQHLLKVVREPEFHQLLSRTIETGKPQQMTLALRASEARRYDVRATPLAAGGSPGAIAVLRDIMELMRLERIRKDFVANVSHELRTPLSAIRGYAETLLDGALDDPENRVRFVEIIHRQADHLSNIALDLLTLSEMESGRPLEPPGPVSVSHVVNSALRVVEAEATLRGVHLHAEGVEDASVIGYPTRLEQAVVNLLANAVKFNRPGGDVWLESRRTPKGDACITVSDNGIGIPSADLGRIFERFYRVDKARSRNTGGTGLGLSIVKHLAEQMKGTVEVESQLGKGTRFRLTIPTLPVENGTVSS